MLDSHSDLQNRRQSPPATSVLTHEDGAVELEVGLVPVLVSTRGRQLLEIGQGLASLPKL